MFTKHMKPLAGFGGPSMVAFTVAILVATTMPAAAHTVSNSKFVYRSSADCHWGKAEIEDGSSNSLGSARILRQALQQGVQNCSSSLVRSTSKLRAKLVVEKKVGGVWQTCINSGFRYPADPDWEMSLVTQGFAGSCGAGTYRIKSGGGHLWGSSWHGGVVYSGTHGNLNPPTPV